MAIEVVDLIGLPAAAQARPHPSFVDAVGAQPLVEEVDIAASGHQEEQLPIAERRLEVPRG